MGLRVSSAESCDTSIPAGHSLGLQGERYEPVLIKMSVDMHRHLALYTSTFDQHTTDIAKGRRYLRKLSLSILLALFLALPLAADQAGTGSIYSGVKGLESGHPIWTRGE